MCKTQDPADILFVTDFIPTTDDIREQIDCVVFKNYRRFCYSLCIATMLFCLLLNRIIAAGILFIFFFLIIRFFHRQLLKLLIRRLQLAISSGTNVKKHVFYSNQFEIGSGTFRYNQITKVIPADFCLYIILQKVSVVMVKKDAFTTGTYDDFVVFLRDKLHDNPKALKGLR